AGCTRSPTPGSRRSACGRRRYTATARCSSASSNSIPVSSRPLRRHPIQRGNGNRRSDEPAAGPAGQVPAKEEVMTAQTGSPIAGDVTAFGEQLRKTAAQATEQARQTISTAQEQFQQSVSQAQQSQRDVIGALARLSEQNSRLAGAAFSSFWD